MPEIRTSKSKIVELKTSIENKTQFVVLRCENAKEVKVRPCDIYDLLVFEHRKINQWERIIGGYIIFNTLTPYKKGESVPAGFLNKKSYSYIAQDDLLIHTFDLYPPNNQFEMDLSLFRDFQRIIKITIKKGKEGKKSYVLIEGEKINRFMPQRHFEVLSGLSPEEFYLASGSYMTYDCWKKGESFETNSGYNFSVTKDEMILRDPSIRINDNYSDSYDHFIHEIGECIKKHKQQSNQDYHSKKNYAKYGAPSDGYSQHLDDDFIDDALSGFPDAIWNID